MNIACTAERFTQRFLSLLSVCLSKMSYQKRNIKQTNTKSQFILKCDVYIRASMDSNIFPWEVHRFLKPLQHIPESGLHSYLTSLDLQSSTPSMSRSRYDWSFSVTCEKCFSWCGHFLGPRWVSYWLQQNYLNNGEKESQLFLRNRDRHLGKWQQ